MHFRYTAVVIVMALALCLSSCAKPAPPDTGGRLNVVVTTDALFEMAAYIGGERASVIKLIPDGVELHDFEPRAKDIVSLGSADILITNGLGLEPWISGAVNASGNDALEAVDASISIQPLLAVEHGGIDPHAWLSPTCGVSMAKSVRDALINADPANRDYYTQNCADFTAQLDALFDEYSAVFASSENRTIVTAHAVFAYLCRDFGLTQESVEGVFAEGEPSPQRLAELVDFCRDNGITTVFAESGQSSKIVETLARETGARVVTIYTMEAAEDGLSYLERMEHNLAAIAEAVCG